MKKEKKGITVGTVTEIEKTQLLDYSEKLSSLKELLLLFRNDFVENKDDFNIVYEKFVKDYTNTKKDIQNWWNEKSNKYLWEGKGSNDRFWMIDFNTREIILCDR